MARIRKECPDCGGWQPCTITLAPPTDFRPDPHHNAATYVVTCNTCGHEYAPDATTPIVDAKGWAKATKAAHGSLLHPDGTIRE